MNYKNIISFFVLFTLKESLSAQPVALSLQYDITKSLDQWFAQLLTIDPNTVKARESLFSAENYKLAKVEYNFNDQVKSCQKKLLFMNVNFYMHWKDRDGTTKISKMIWNFPKNKICVLFSKLRITVESEIRHNQSEPDVKLFTTLNFRNLTLCATVSPTNSRNISYDISYDQYYLYNYGYEKEVQWSGEVHDTEKLTPKVKSALIAMLCENIKRNENFSQTFSSLVRNYTQNEKGVFFIHPATLTLKQKYYYLIPNVPFYRFALKSIKIKGLSNVESITVYNNPDVFTHSLLVKNLRGDVILDYGSECEEAPKPLELYFKIDYLSISLRNRANCAHVEAKFYEFNSTKGSLTYRQSTFLMQKIESAIVSSLMPSKGVWKTCNIELPVDEFKDTDSKSKCNWEKIKEVYKDWIPFPSDEVFKISKMNFTRHYILSNMI